MRENRPARQSSCLRNRTRLRARITRNTPTGRRRAAPGRANRHHAGSHREDLDEVRHRQHGTDRVDGAGICDRGNMNPQQHRRQHDQERQLHRLKLRLAIVEISRPSPSTVTMNSVESPRADRDCVNRHAKRPPSAPARSAVRRTPSVHTDQLANSSPPADRRDKELLQRTEFAFADDREACKEQEDQLQNDRDQPRHEEVRALQVGL